MTGKLRRALHLGGIAALALATAACGGDDDKPETKSVDTTSFSLFSPIGSEQWPGGFPAGADEIVPEFSEADYFGSALPEAVPMVHPLRGQSRQTYADHGRGYVGGYDYAPDFYDDYPMDEPIYYDSDPDEGSYAWLALASALGGVFGDAPPDYYFDYDDGVEPWVWETGDNFVRYAEPIDDGYRYYYYSPGRSYPFLVRDPHYSYGYYNDRVAVIYDNEGRVLDSRRSWRQRQIAERYYGRARDLHQAARLRPRRGVVAPLWNTRQALIAREQSQWDRARDQRQGWRDWDRRNERSITPRWNRERVARQYATQRFDSWRDDGYRSAAPRFYREAQRTPQMREVVQQQRDQRRAIMAQRREERRGFGQQASQQRANWAQRTALRDQPRAERQQRFVTQQARSDTAQFRQERSRIERQRLGGQQRLQAREEARVQRFQAQSQVRRDAAARTQRPQSPFQARQEARNQRAQATQARQQAGIQRAQAMSQARQQARMQRSQEMSQARQQARMQRSQEMSQVRQQARMQRSQEMSQVRQQARMQRSQEMSQVRQQARMQRSHEMSQARQQVRMQRSQEMSQARQQARAQQAQAMSQAREQRRASMQSQPRPDFRAQQQASRQEFRAQRQQQVQQQSQARQSRFERGGNDQRMR